MAFIDEHRERFGVEPICRVLTEHGCKIVEFATMTYVDWFNHRRLHGEITDDASYTTPAEHEANYYSQNPTTLEVVTQ